MAEQGGSGAFRAAEQVGPDEPSSAPGASIPLLGADEALGRAAAAGVPDMLARLHVFRLLLRRPPLAKGVADLLLSLLAGAALDVRRRELIILRVAWRTASAYEWGQHWRIASDLGLPVDDLAAVRHWDDADCFGPEDRLVLQAVDEVVEHGQVAPATVGSLVGRLGEDAALEAVAAVAAWSMVSTLLRSCAVPLEPDLEWWPPDGIGPGGADHDRDRDGAAARSWHNRGDMTQQRGADR